MRRGCWTGAARRVGVAMVAERGHLLRPAAEGGFDLAEASFPSGRGKQGCATVQDQCLFGAGPGGDAGGGAGASAAHVEICMADGGLPATNVATAAASRCWTSSTTSTCWATSRAPWLGPGR